MSPNRIDATEYEVLQSTRVLDTPMIPRKVSTINRHNDSVQS
jgi:hypothetical protein